MHWPAATSVLRVDGESAILVIKNPPAGLTKAKFEHDYASEVLRSAIVASISAMDKYFHDRTLNVCFTLLRKSESGLPKKLRKLELPAHLGFSVQRRLKKNPSSRPGNDLKKALQEKLHLLTFQNTNGVNACTGLMGIEDFWSRTANEMGADWTPGKVQSHLEKCVERRNQIVHEADLERKISSNKFPLRDVTAQDARAIVDFIKLFIGAAEDVIDVSVAR